MPASQTAQLLDLKRSLGSRLETEEVGLPDEWELADGVIRHRRTEFFQIVGQRFPDHGEMILIRQQETGLIALLVARVADESWVLIDARVEPGLPGGCQFTTTVQSTPSNYLRRHGGKATPFLDHFLEPGEDVRVLHDSRQYDWGQYYDSKIKRFMIVEIDADDALPATSETAVWVRERDLAELIRTDHAVTSDLRAMTTLLVAIRDGITAAAPVRTSVPQPSGLTEHDVPLSDLDNWKLHDHGLDEIVHRHGTGLRYVRTRAHSREVVTWSQPLVTVDGGTRVSLLMHGDRYAVIWSTKPGLRGEQLWHPAVLTNSAARTTTVRSVDASAEGGRFLHHEVDLSVAEIVDPDAVEPGARWMTRDELLALALADCATGVDLRLALNLVLEAP